MSVVFSGSWSGSFTSTGASQLIVLPAGADYCHVYNETVLGAGGAGTGAQFYWRKGMTQGLGIVYNKTAATNALAPATIAANLGFFWQDTTVSTPGAAVALTGITNGNPPLVQTGNTAGLIALSSIVRIYSTVGALQLGGMDFTVNTITPATSFELAYAPAIVNASPGAGTYRIIPFNPYFYPSTRYITKITQAAQAVVTLSVTHSYIVGQKVTFKIPTVTAAAFGMTQLNGITATIIRTGDADTDGITNTITVDVDTTGYTAFALPLTAAPAFSYAMVVPAGENTAIALNAGLNIYSDAMLNTGSVGLLLMAGNTGPAGVNTNVISWVAGKSFNE
jgi:hypothetical protein